MSGEFGCNIVQFDQEAVGFGGTAVAAAPRPVAASSSEVDVVVSVQSRSRRHEREQLGFALVAELHDVNGGQNFGDFLGFETGNQNRTLRGNSILSFDRASLL